MKVFNLFGTINRVAFMAIPFSLLINIRINTFCIIVFIITTILSLKSRFFVELKKAIINKWVLLFMSLYLFQIIRYPYHAQDFSAFFSSIDTQLGILLFPIFIYLYFSKHRTGGVDKTFQYFSFTTIVLGIVIVLYSIILNNGYSFEEITKTIPNGHIYYGAFLCFSGSYFLSKIVQQEKTNKINLPFSLLALIALIAIGSRTMTFLYLSLCVFTFFKYVGKKDINVNIRIIGISFTVIFSVLFVIIFFPRFSEVLNDRAYNPLYIRSILWDCTLRLFLDHFLWGLGTVDLQPYLLECYHGKHKFYWGDDLNPHNEYLRIAAKYGVSGLILLFSVFLSPLIKTARKKDTLYMFFLIAIIFLSFFECIFERQVGVVFYAYFNSVLFFFLRRRTFC